MPSSAGNRLAVLIDADNTSARHAANLMEEVAKYGVPTVKRAYGDWTTQNLVGWKSKLNEHAIQPMQQFAYTTGKNSTDSALIIDAMDLLYSGNLDAFAIVSSDSDFTRLVTRLRESGITVYGLGLRKTPRSLQNACDRFIFLELLEETPQDESPDAAPSTPPETGPASGSPDKAPDPAPGVEQHDEHEEPAAKPVDVRSILTAAINATTADNGWAALSAVGSHISRTTPSFDARDHGAPKLVELVRQQNYLDVEQTESGPVRVRLRSARPPRKKAAATPA